MHILIVAIAPDCFNEGRMSFRPPALALPVAFAILLTLLALPVRADDAAPVPASPPPADSGPKAVAVGKGSYAESPPNPDKNVAKMLARPIYIDPSQEGKPIPTNDWWTDLLFSHPSGMLWAYPLVVKMTDAGPEIHYPTGWKGDGHDLDPGPPFTVTAEADDGTPLASAGARVLRWGDWTLTARIARDEAHRLDATIGRGLPFVWIECQGATPRFALDGGAELLDENGKPATLPLAASRAIVRKGDRLFALFAPDGASFEAVTATSADAAAKNAGPAVRVKGASFLVVAALPDAAQMPLFASCAYAVPRDSRFDWNYDPAKGEVATTWTVTTDLLQGTSHDVLQGWLPHHYRATAQHLAFAGPEYLTPRGKLRVAKGTVFEIAWPFHGIPPMVPAPASTALAGKPNPYQPDRLAGYVADYAQSHAAKPPEKRFGADTYWGGKDLTQYGLYAAIAKETGDDTSYQSLSGMLRDCLANWFTYTPGEEAHYFARYERYKGMVGFKASFGSESFTDNHFHYGYFTLAAALQGLYDPQFLADYGPMARLVAKQYANWDRNDTAFPFLRTFDPWGGHSYAGGSSSGNGNNQESSSEAMQSWTGLFLLGVVLQDKEMTAAGAMGWAIERSAVDEYWNDYYGWRDGAAASNFPPSYAHSLVGIVGDSGGAFGTFFSGEPHHIYGIQWLPISTGLYYLGHDPKFTRYQYDQMMAEEARKVDEEAKKGKNKTLYDPASDADWGDVFLGYLQFGDPDAVAAQFDAAWDANQKTAKNGNLAGITYYFIHADRQLGPVADDCHAELPASLVYRGADGKSLTLVAWNAADAPASCRVWRGDTLLSTVTVPPRKLSVLPLPETSP